MSTPSPFVNLPVIPSDGEPQRFSYYPAIPPPVRISLVTTGAHACPYLPGRLSTNRAFRAEAMPPQVYQALMDCGFRRSGKIVYQPACSGCRKCIPIRVPVATFTPSKSQRRCWRANQDLTVTIGVPRPDEERFQLYQRYVTQWHGARDQEEEQTSYDSFVTFLYDSPLSTLEYTYRDAAGKLVAVGICDVCDTSLSSVYFYHDPGEAKRGVGTFGALVEIAEAHKNHIPYYYLGYWVDGCRTMAYKSLYRPFEMLHTDGVWRAGDSAQTTCVPEVP